MSALEEKSAAKCFGGTVKQFAHKSEELGCDMTFVAFVPSKAETGKVPVLWFLSGLTCTDQNFATKAGALRAAEEHGLMLVMPDTSPRGCGVEGEDESWDFGTGAGFYLDATREPFKKNYRMYSYVTKELRKVVVDNLPAHPDLHSIFGHSMGGHGALTLYLKNPGLYLSCSAFAPICNPCICPWGQKAFAGYFGDDDKELWKAHDATELAAKYDGPPADILIDQGKADSWLEGQLFPHNFVRAAAGNKIQVVLRMQEGYDHGYYFIQTFIDDHIRHHAEYLNMK